MGRQIEGVGLALPRPLSEQVELGHNGHRHDRNHGDGVHGDDDGGGVQSYEPRLPYVQHGQLGGASVEHGTVGIGNTACIMTCIVQHTVSGSPQEQLLSLCSHAAQRERPCCGGVAPDAPAWLLAVRR